MYNLVVWLSVIIIALIVVFVAYAQVTNEIIKHYQSELKKERYKYLDYKACLHEHTNCILTNFGKCSYNKTGCSDCEIKNKIRKALNENEKGE
mgnify:CR=1 FL=1